GELLVLGNVEATFASVVGEDFLFGFFVIKAQTLGILDRDFSRFLLGVGEACGGVGLDELRRVGDAVGIKRLGARKSRRFRRRSAGKKGRSDQKELNQCLKCL